jgi:hypothetical protein
MSPKMVHLEPPATSGRTLLQTGHRAVWVGEAGFGKAGLGIVSSTSKALPARCGPIVASRQTILKTRQCHPDGDLAEGHRAIYGDCRATRRPCQRGNDLEAETPRLAPGSKLAGKPWPSSETVTCRQSASRFTSTRTLPWPCFRAGDQFHRDQAELRQLIGGRGRRGGGTAVRSGRSVVSHASNRGASCGEPCRPQPQRQMK